MQCGETTGECDEHATRDTRFASHSAANPTLPESKREFLSYRTESEKENVSKEETMSSKDIDSQQGRLC